MPHLRKHTSWLRSTHCDTVQHDDVRGLASRPKRGRPRIACPQRDAGRKQSFRVYGNLLCHEQCRVAPKRRLSFPCERNPSLHRKKRPRLCSSTLPKPLAGTLSTGTQVISEEPLSRSRCRPYLVRPAEKHCPLQEESCRNASGLGPAQNGSSLVELALLVAVFVLLLAGSVDLGQACYVAIELSAAANAGAQYGTLAPTNTSGMQKAALLNATNLKGLSSSASWGCECSDGSSASASCAIIPSCSSSKVRYVTVTTSLTYMPALIFPGVPSSLALKGNARLRAAY